MLERWRVVGLAGSRAARTCLSASRLVRSASPFSPYPRLTKKGRNYRLKTLPPYLAVSPLYLPQLCGQP